MEVKLIKRKIYKRRRKDMKKKIILLAVLSISALAFSGCRSQKDIRHIATINGIK